MPIGGRTIGAEGKGIGAWPGSVCGGRNGGGATKGGPWPGIKGGAPKGGIPKGSCKGIGGTPNGVGSLGSIEVIVPVASIIYWEYHVFTAALCFHPALWDFLTEGESWVKNTSQ